MYVVIEGVFMHVNQVFLQANLETFVYSYVIASEKMTFSKHTDADMR